MQEIFKDINEFENYQISNLGRVFSKKRNKFLLLQITKFGYAMVQIRSKKSHKNFLVHRLVANAFIEPKKDKLFVNHIDCNKLNNSVNNLEWVTPKGNAAHTLKMNRYNKMFADKNPMYKIDIHNHPRAVKIINTETKEITYIKIAAKLLNVSEGHLCNMLKNKKTNKTKFIYYEQ